MTATIQEAESRIRSAYLLLDGVPEADRADRLRAEIEAALARVPEDQREELLDGLAEAFPSWPPDVPPPPPPSDEELIEMLGARAAESREDKERIERLMRGHDLGCGLAAEDVRRIRGELSLDPASADPDAGRTAEAFSVLLRAMGQVDEAARGFLHDQGLGMTAAGTPKVLDTLARLLTLPDENPARHAEMTKLESACAMAARVVTLMSQWPEGVADRMADQFAPNKIEAVVPAKMMGRKNHQALWDEYVARLGRQGSEENYKEKVLDLIRRELAESV